MCFYIGIEDLVANALIAVLKNDSSKRRVSYAEMESYGAAVVNFLNEKNEKAVLIFSRDRTDAFFHNYSDFFEEYEENGEAKGISLKAEKSLQDLIMKFRGYLSLDLLLAFISENSIKALYD